MTSVHCSWPYRSWGRPWAGHCRLWRRRGWHLRQQVWPDHGLYLFPALLQWTVRWMNPTYYISCFTSVWRVFCAKISNDICFCLNIFRYSLVSKERHVRIKSHGSTLGLCIEPKESHGFLGLHTVLAYISKTNHHLFSLQNCRLILESWVNIEQWTLGQSMYLA